jgi:DnaK suppressor protein
MKKSRRTAQPNVEIAWYRKCTPFTNRKFVIFNPRSKPCYIHFKFNAYLDKLHALRTRLDAHAAELREESSHGADGETAEGFSNAPVDAADRASQKIEIAVSIGLAENEANLRTEIDAALDRVNRGTFGICEECGTAIGANRLNAIPYARFCIRCERRIEQRATR